MPCITLAYPQPQERSPWMRVASVFGQMYHTCFEHSPKLSLDHYESRNVCSSSPGVLAASLYQLVLAASLYQLVLAASLYQLVLAASLYHLHPP